MNEKLTVLQQIVTQMEKLHDSRQVGNKDIYDAHIALFHARMDLCEKDEDRLAVLEEMLSLAKRREATIKELPKNTIRGLPQEALILPLQQATVDRLNIEIEIERLKSK
jgi:hypothetical protein